MDTLLADRPMSWMTAGALVLAMFAALSGAASRARSLRIGQRVKRLYWMDATTCAWSWAAATAVLAVAGMTGIEGLGMPVWILADLLVGVAIAGILSMRWRRERLGRLPDADTSDRTRPTTLLSTSWESGFVAACAGVLLAYGASMGHGFGHPIHWIVTAFGIPLGYAIGIALVTPRYTVRRPR